MSTKKQTATNQDTEMEKTQMITRQRVEGEVQYNNGEFAEVLTFGIEGIEKDLALETIQIHCEDTGDTPEQFRQRFPVGTTLSILTITEITRNRVRRALQSNSGGSSSPELRRSVRSKLGAAIRAQRQSWDTALSIQEITGYAGDIYAFVAEMAGALKDDEAIPDDLVDDLISSASMPKLHPRPTSQTPRIQ
jgi:hypothetical protein